MPIDDGRSRGELFPRKRDSLRVAPLRIGGRDQDGRQRTASPLELAHDVTAPDPSMQLVIDDWRRFEGALRLNLIQQRVFDSFFKKGIPRNRLGRALGLTPRQVDASLGAIDAALAKLKHGLGTSAFSLEPATRSLALGYREQLQSGRRVFTLSRLDDAFLDIISQERFCLFSQRDRDPISSPRKLQGHRLGSYISFMQIDDLKKTLIAERSKLDRLIAGEQKARLVLRGAEIDLSNLEQSSASEQVASILAETTWSAGDHARKVTAATAKIAAAQSALTATRGAIAAQQALVEATEGDIFSGRRELLVRELKPLKPKLFATLKQLCELSLELRTLAHKHDFGDVTRELFPDPDTDTLSIFPAGDRGAQLLQGQLINTSLYVSDYLRARYEADVLQAAS